MNKHLIAEFQQLGADNKGAVLAAHVYMELSEVKKYWNPTYYYNEDLKTMVIKAKKRPSDNYSIFLPISSYETLSFSRIQEYFSKCDNGSIFLSIVHPDSTCVYYKITNDLAEPTEITAKHSREDRQEKLDSTLRKHRKTLEQAALFQMPISLPRNKSDPSTSGT